MSQRVFFFLPTKITDNEFFPWAEILIYTLNADDNRSYCQLVRFTQVDLRQRNR